MIYIDLKWKDMRRHTYEETKNMEADCRNGFYHRWDVDGTICLYLFVVG